MDFNSIDDINEHNKFMKYNNIKFTCIKENYAETELEISENSLNPYGIVHGGIYYTMADCTAGAAARSTGRKYVTLNSSFNFIKSVSKGKIKSVSYMVHRGKSTCVVRVDVIDEKETILAEGLFTMFCIENENFSKKH